MLKTVKALELFFTTVASLIFFQVAVNIQTVISIILIWISLYIYSVNPLRNKDIEQKVLQSEEKRLIKDDVENQWMMIIDITFKAFYVDIFKPSLSLLNYSVNKKK